MNVPSVFRVVGNEEEPSLKGSKVEEKVCIGRGVGACLWDRDTSVSLDLLGIWKWTD